jgi:hypothetical protein
MASKKVMTTNLFSPLSFVAVYGSEIRDPLVKKILSNPRNNFCTGFPLCYWSFSSSVHPSLDAGKICVNVHDLAGFRYDISGPLTLAGSKCFLWSKMLLRAFEEGLWKDFKN